MRFQKTRSSLIVMIACAVLAATADVRAEGAASTELRQLVEAWIDAEVAGDRLALESILHEDFLSTFSNGRTIGRDAYIDFIVGQTIQPFTVINESTVLYGDTAVVVDVSGSGKTKFTWVAVRSGETWRAVAQTFTSVEQP